MNLLQFLFYICLVIFYSGKVFCDIDGDKAELRQKMIATLKNMTAEERKHESDLVLLKLFHSPAFRTCERIGLYLNTEYEVQTEKLARHMLGQGKRCFIPRRNETSKSIDMVILRSMDDYAAMKVNDWGFKEPDLYEKRENALTKGSMDIMVIPGLAFTLKGERLGRGRGMYDKYIASIRPRHNPALIGLAYEAQILKNIPRDDEDIKVDTVMHVKHFDRGF